MVIKTELNRRGYKLKEFEYLSGVNSTQRSYLVVSKDLQRSKPLHLILFFGGNAMTGFDAIMWFLDIRPYIENSTRQYGFLAVDYPGYGDSEGDPSPGTIVESVKNAVEKAIGHLSEAYDLKPADAVIIGHSLGSAVATTWLASDPPTDLSIRNLVLSAPFTSVADMASHMFGLPRIISWLVSRHNWDNTRALQLLRDSDVVNGKIYVIHGTEDEIVPYHMGTALSKVGEPKTHLVTLKNYMHNNILDSYKVYAYAISE